ncbi:HupE/UreJ family protein [Roseateles asaccharophilus]|uniref:HupE/UreJ family protein n=1 Tax=Roseateles asaccharophilus TaxID=582607 RepID=A0ABU2A6R5_9BURK|nr:HupE/UreJ family protein [Roseateles asaccharophilus]MDR7332894.1 hypothetical protein [Roseateles asaccharophilus]
MTRWLALLWLAAAPAWAHQASDAYLQLAVQGQAVTLRADIALRDLDRDLVLDADDDGQLTWAEVRGREADLQALVARDVPLQVSDDGGRPCAPGPFAPLQLASRGSGTHAVLQRTWTCAAAPAGAALDYRLFAATDPTHRGLLAWRGTAGVVAPGGAPLRLALDASAAADAPGLGAVFRDGVHHIWIGIDHVLFLLVLLLPAVLRREAGHWRPADAWRPALWRVVGIVTAFTLAHSITLALAAFGWLQPPARAVESLIAFSVLLAALNNLRPVVVDASWRFTFAFGLVHGFGFANVLQELGLQRGDMAWPLLAFNLGVEAGQLAIVAVAVPLAWAARRWRGYPRWVLGAGSAAVALLALVWLVERAFDIQLLGGEP